MASENGLTDRQILERIRAEFDHLWSYYGRDDGFLPGADITMYVAALENLLMNRLQEAKLHRNECCIGLPQWSRRQQNAT